MTIETVFPFDVAVRFVSTKVCSVMGARNHDSLSDSKKQISIIADQPLMFLGGSLSTWKESMQISPFC